MLGADGTPVPVYGEIAQVGAEFAQASKALAGTTVVSQVALINDYPSRWAIGWQRHAAKFDPLDAQVAWYGPLQRSRGRWTCGGRPTTSPATSSSSRRD